MHGVAGPGAGDAPVYAPRHSSNYADTGCGVGRSCRPPQAVAPWLTRVVGAWPTLPEPLRRAVLAMIEAAG